MRTCALWIAALLVPALYAQAPKFEVASVKECKATDRPPPSTNSPVRLSLACWPLWRLIGDAFETFADGKQDPLKLPVALPAEGPEWVNSTDYSIDAKAETPQAGPMLRGPMMRALLEERFQAKVHREMREVSGYVMTVDKGGLKLKPSTEDSCIHVDLTDLTQKLVPGAKPWCMMPKTKPGPVNVYDVRGMTLDVYCRLLHPGGRPVVNGTGLTGPYDIHLEWPMDEPPAADGAALAPAGTSLIAAIRSQLGLRLDPGKGKREVLVIDHIERPSEN